MGLYCGMVHRLFPDRSRSLLVRHLAIVGALCLFILLGGHALAAGPIQVQVRMDGPMLVVDGWLETAVDAPLAWSVLTDYEGFTRFVPGIRANRVVRREGPVRWIEQQGETLAMGLRMPYVGRMRVEEIPGQRIAILFLSGPFRDVRGEWRIGEGRPLRLAYQMRMDLMKSPYPPALAGGIAEQQVRMWVDVFATEMERRQLERSS